MPVLNRPTAPNLPVAPAQYAATWQNQFANVLRLFFNQLIAYVTAPMPYGSFYDTTSHPNSVANTVNYIGLNNTVSSYNTSMKDNGKIYVTQAGIYNLQFSAQVQRTGGGGASDIFFWVIQNGHPVTDSAGYATVATGNGAKTITGWNYMLPLGANDYVQLAWQSADTGLSLPTLAASGNIPASPAIILTINWISEIPL